MTSTRIDSVWDLLVSRIAALELAVLELQKRLDECEETWIGGNDGPDD